MLRISLYNVSVQKRRLTQIYADYYFNYLFFICINPRKSAFLIISFRFAHLLSKYPYYIVGAYRIRPENIHVDYWTHSGVCDTPLQRMEETQLKPIINCLPLLPSR